VLAIRRHGPPLVGFLLLVIAWQVSHAVFGWNSIVVPSPGEVLGAMTRHSGRLVTETAVTLAEAMGGFLIGGMLGYGTAVAFVLFPRLRQAALPYAIALKSTPLVVLAPVLVMWFGNGYMSKAVMAALVAFFPVLVSSLDGLLSVDRELIDMMTALSASEGQILKALRIPNSLPSLFSGLKTASTLAIVGALIGEFTGSIRGIGHLINSASYYLETDLVFAAVVLVSLAGVGFFACVAWLERVVVFWRR